MKNHLIIYTLILLSICLAYKIPTLFASEPVNFTQDTSENLMIWAWENYSKGNYDRAIKWAELCAYFWGPRAKLQSKDLTRHQEGSILDIYAKYWALNDVGTAWLIIGESFRKKGEDFIAGSGTKAETAYRMLTDENYGQGPYFYSQCASDSTTGEHYLWKPADMAYARLIGYKEEKLDNVGLLKNAWENLNINNREKARKFAELCINMYTKDLPAQWAINDLGTSWFIIGEAWRLDGEPDKAREAYQKVINDFPTSQCYDPTSNSYWNVADAAREKL